MTQANSVKRPTDPIVQSVESGPIVIDILRGSTADGHTYLYYQPSRVWQPKNGTRRNFSGRFYERNEKDFLKAIQQASVWMRKNPNAAEIESVDADAESN